MKSVYTDIQYNILEIDIRFIDSILHSHICIYLYINIT